MGLGVTGRGPLSVLYLSDWRLSGSQVPWLSIPSKFQIILKILPEAISIFGADTPACMAVDLTKVSQKIIRGSLSQLLAIAKEKRIKGELVLLISAGS